MNFLALVRPAHRAQAIAAIACASLSATLSLAAPPSTPSAAAILQPVVVSATRFPEDAASLPFGVSVLTAADIAEAGVSTVNEALMKLLGIPGRLDLNGGGEYVLDLRGFGSTSDSNQVVVVDGIRISEADTGGTRLAGIPIDAVERIEVLRGSGTVLYGEGATGGVIVITTKAGRGSARSNRVQAYAATGSDGLRELRVGATVQFGDVSLDAAANQRRADNDRDNQRSKVEGGSVGVQWRNDWLRFGARHSMDQLESGLPGSLTAEQYRENPRQSTTPDDRGAIRNEHSGLFAEADLGGWQLALDAGWRHKELSSEFVSYGGAYAYEVDARNFAARARNQTELSGGINAFVIGVDRGEWERRVEGDYGSAAEQTSTGVYLKDDLTLAGGTRLSAGWRSERFDKRIDTAPESVDRRQQAWEAGLLQPLSESLAAYGRLGRSFRLANVDEFSFATPGLALRPQTSQDVELGVRWRGGSSSAEGRVYRSRLRDEIGYDPKAVGPSSIYGFDGANVNYDPTRREGFELEVVHAVAAALKLRLNAALRRSRFSEGPYAGRDVPLTSRRTLTMRVDWSPADGHKVGAGVSLASSQSPDFENLCRIPGHATADLRYAYRWARTELSLGVANLTDRKYFTQAFGCSAAGETGAIYPEPGRMFTTAVRLYWP